MENNFHSELSIPFIERIKVIPGIFGIHLQEQTYYEILRSDGPFEVRFYHPLKMATITLDDSSKEAQKEAFISLAGYIFGNNISGEKMIMTYPVVQEDQEISFILPQEYITKTIPSPTDDRIVIKQTQFRLVATVTYTGTNTDEKIAEHTIELKKWLKKHPWYLPVGHVQTALYDCSLTLPFLRKNELHLEVKNMH
jgi:hypothetical protein